MSQTVTLELSDEICTALTKEAEREVYPSQRGLKLPCLYKAVCRVHEKQT